MDGGNILSHTPNMKGFSIELPFIKFKYLKIEGEKDQRIPEKSRVCIPPPQKEQGAGFDTFSCNHDKKPSISTLGADPMISSASVIHEIVYGRPEPASGSSVRGFKYLSSPTESTIDTCI